MSTQIPLLRQHLKVSDLWYKDALAKCKGDFARNRDEPECKSVITEAATFVMTSGINVCY